MTMFVDKDTMNIVSMQWLAVKHGVALPYNKDVTNNPSLLHRLRTDVVLDEKDGDVPTNKCEERNGKYYRTYRPYTKAEKTVQKQTLVQSLLDSKAQELGYDSIHTAVTYADEASVPQFQAEGKALRTYRSQCWAKCYEVLADVEAGNISEPTDEELVALMPAFVAP